MPSLFDKLSKTTQAPSPAPAAPPASEPAPAMFAKPGPKPGPFTQAADQVLAPAPADLHSPHDPLARGPGSPKPLMEKLRSVGGVNPPAPARAPAPPPATPEPSFHGFGSESPARAPAPPPPGPSAPAPAPAADGNACPHCGQVFKVLARHRCKGAPASAPAPEPAAPRKLYCAFCGDEISDLPSHMAGCKRAPGAAPAGAPAPEPVAPPLPVPTVGEFMGATPVQIPPRPEPVADPAPGPTPAPVAEPGPAPEPVGAPAPTKSARHIEELTSGNVTERSALDGYVLFLDVLFEKNEFDPTGLKHFSDIVAPLAEQVARENKAVHWGTVEYNRGGSLLAAKLEGWIKHVNPVGVILADGSTPECRACKETLKRYAKVVIQGVR